MANCLVSPLESKDIADAAIYMLKQPLHISVKAMDVVPTGKMVSGFLKSWSLTLATAQRSLTTFDRQWDERNGN